MKFQGLEYTTPITIDSRNRVSRSETLNLKTQAVDNGSQRWDLSIGLAPNNNKKDLEATAVYDPLSANRAGAALAAHRAINGLHRAFKIEMPQHLGIEATGVTTSLRAVVTSATVNFSNSGSLVIKNVSGPEVVLPAGLFITIGSPGGTPSASDKVYMVVTETTIAANESTGTSVPLFPNLIAPVGAVEKVVNVRPQIFVYYALDGVDGVSYVDGIMVSSTINVIEALV